MSTYSFIDVNATMVGIGGVINLGNGAAVSEEGITISQVEDKNVQVIGADGEVMNTLRASKAGTVTVRILKTSPVNAQLMAMYDAQSLSSVAWGNNVITVSNPTVGDMHICQKCAFKKKPDINNKKDADILEWVFDAGKVDNILGTYV